MDAVALRKSGLTSFTFDCGSQQANNVILVKLLARPMRRLALMARPQGSVCSRKVSSCGTNERSNVPPN
jgi:hypothetical protein